MLALRDGNGVPGVCGPFKPLFPGDFCKARIQSSMARRLKYVYRFRAWDSPAKDKRRFLAVWLSLNFPMILNPSVIF